MRYVIIILLFITQDVLGQGGNPFAGCHRPSNYAEGLMRDVLEHASKYADLPQIQFCKNYFVPNAYAQAYQWRQGFNYPVQTIFRIDYNPHFMGHADVTVNNAFALIGILAHEVGHIEHFAQLSNPFSQQSWEAYEDLTIPWEKELRADEFAGFVLAKMDASVGDVVSTQRTIFTLHTNPQYANSVTRLRRMFEGYIDGKGNEASRNEIEKLIEAQEEAQEKIVRQYMRWQ